MRDNQNNNSARDKHWLVNGQHHFVYCEIPKNACTSLKHWFIETLGQSPVEIARIHIFSRKNYALDRYSDQEAERIRQSFFKFVFVRDPWSRLISAYADKFLSKEQLVNWNNKPVIEEVWQSKGHDLSYDTIIPVYVGPKLRDSPGDSAIDYERGISFREFVAHICQQDDDKMNVHWRPQYWFLGNMAFDYVGRVENLKQGLTDICRILDLPRPLLPHKNRVERGNIAGGKNLADVPAGILRQYEVAPLMEQFWTPDLVELVANRYYQDIEMFGYSYRAA